MEKPSLWLPKGSVRSIIAIGISAMTGYLAFMDKISGEQFLTIATVVIMFYFKREDNLEK